MDMDRVRDEADSVHFFLMDDGDTVCPHCIRDHERDVEAAIVENRNNGWRPTGVVLLAEGEVERCCVCGDDTTG